MAQKQLGTAYLPRLSNANHYGVTTQIDDRVAAYETENQMVLEAASVVHQRREAEDTAYKRFSGKDFASDDLKKEDRLEDQYMSVIHNILLALMMLPDEEPLKRKAEVAERLYKDFGFSTKAGYEAEARMTVNMVQEWQTPNKYDLAALGIETWVLKARQQAVKVLNLVAVRVDNESAKVKNSASREQSQACLSYAEAQPVFARKGKGELADARKATDEAIRRLYDVLNALAVLQPSEGLTQLIQQLQAIEDRARQYYISSGKPGTDPQPEPQSEPDGGDDQQDGDSDGEVTPVTPE